MKDTLRAGSRVGAVLGGIMFLILGLVPGFYVSSYGTVVLLAKLTGGPLEPTVFIRAGIVLGTLFVMFVMATLAITLGATFGYTVAWLSETLRAPATEADKATESNKTV